MDRQVVNQRAHFKTSKYAVPIKALISYFIFVGLFAESFRHDSRGTSEQLRKEVSCVFGGGSSGKGDKTPFHLYFSDSQSHFFFHLELVVYLHPTLHIFRVKQID